MSTQYAYSITNAPDGTRQRQGLFPSADSVTSNDGVEYRGKKRKRRETSIDELFKDSFTVRPYPPTIPTKPCLLQPYLLLPRSELSLSSLEFYPSAYLFPRSRLFEAHAKILELEERMGAEPMVLIAQRVNARTFFALEREERGLYAVCQLGSWVNLERLKAAATISRQDLSQIQDDIAPELPPRMPVETPAARKDNVKKRLAIEALQSIIKRPSTSLQSPSRPSTSQESPLKLSAIQEAPVVRTELLESSTEITNPPLENVPQLTAAQIFDTVRNQYLEALYLTKASLAYFAKGPLSRARAAFHLDFDSSLNMNDLVAFLETLVVASTILDKKYRDGVTGCIAEIDMHDHSADESREITKKRKPSKKMKTGKTGLYPLEDRLIRKWWLNHDTEEDADTPSLTRDELIKARIAPLRNRETQLQLIVILEVLALRPLVPASNDNDEGLPASADLLGGTEAKSMKNKKPDHLNMLIDLHLDRLCIWQSITLESANSEAKYSQVLKGNGMVDPSVGNAKQVNNDLRDFCIDVIVPFFLPRLPDRCARINRKLGGPIAASPAKVRASKCASSTRPKPGAATKRAVPARLPRDLKRCLTDERERERRSVSCVSSRPILLSRSATAPVLGIKTEPNDYKALAPNSTIENQVTRGSILESKRFARRQVNLSTITSRLVSKAEKQAIVDAELQAAITSIKRPNRVLVGRVISDTAEQHAITHSGKSKKPSRNTLFHDTQIMATPKLNRHKALMTESQVADLPSATEELVPTSNLPAVPESISQPLRDTGVIRNTLYEAVQATPTRRLLAPGQPRAGILCPPPIDYVGFPPSSPIQVQRSSAQLFAPLPKSVLQATKDYSAKFSLPETPLRTRPQSMTNHAHPTRIDGKENEVQTICANKEIKMRDTPELESVYKLWDDVDGMADELV